MSTGRGNVTTRFAAVRPRERVAAWPRVSATVRPDATGTITVNGTERPCSAESVDALRTGMIARCATLARRLRRPVRLTVTDGPDTWSLAVRADGIVQLLHDDGTIEPADGLAPQEGRCRVCRRLQPVTAAACTQCGIDEPHRVETNPLDARTVVPDAAETVDALDDEPPASTPARPALNLAFSTQPDVKVTEGVALGRNPEPIGGRRPIQVASPDRMLSRTHVLIDVDDAGRIVVTDHHSGNGTEAQTEPPTPLIPGMPYVLRDGTTLLLGDVECTITRA